MTACNTGNPALPTLRGLFSVDKRTEWIGLALATFAFIVGFAANYELRATVIRQTHVVHVKQSFGKPDQTLDGAQINPNLAGFTCDVYQTKQTIICHRP